MRLLMLLAFLVTASPSPVPYPQKDPHQPDPRVDVLHYAFRLTLSDETDEIRGETTLTVRFREAGVEAIVLDLIGRSGGHGMTVRAVRAGEADLPFRHEADRLTVTLPAPATAGDVKTLRVAYHGIPADGLIISENKYGDRTFFGDNWPDRARHWLPVVDHPADKALCEFTVVAPAHYQVVGCGARVEWTDRGDGTTLTHWRSTVPMATKVMVVGVARFAIQYVDEYEGTPIETWVYPQDREAGFYDYALAERILQFFDDHIGPFPYAKLANVQSKTRFGGMENASNIFYSENSVRGNRQSESLLAHEIAHQWFGDSVTERDWHHIWLSEGFATYFTQLYLENTYGRDRMNAGLRTMRTGVLAQYERTPTAPIVDTTVTDLMQLLNANSYQKGGWTLHMLRHTVGDGAFWDGIRTYYRTYRDGNALTEDFRHLMEAAAGQDLAWFFDQWVYRPGVPEVHGSWQYADGALTLTLEQAVPGDPFRLPIEVGIYAPGDDLPRIETVVLDAPAETFTLPVDAPPEKVVLDPNTWMLMKATFGPR